MIEALRSFARPQAARYPALSGPALVLGSGPRAEIPAGFNDAWVLATVNASQAGKSARNLRNPDVTLFGASVLKSNPSNLEAQAALTSRGTRNLVTIKGSRRYSTARLKLLLLRYRYESFSFLTRADRLAAVASVTGHRVQDSARPSNGIVLACLCLHWGCEEVVMTGFSLTQGGHSYNDSGRDRRHVSEDREILQRAIANGARIATNDPVFASESGVPLWHAAYA